MNLCTERKKSFHIFSALPVALPDHPAAPPYLYLLRHCLSASAAYRQITGETYVKRLSGYYEFVYREEKMRADKIKTIIGNINDLPYKTILFDGTWGVGKSYAVNEALAGNPDVCKISMFGMTDARHFHCICQTSLFYLLTFLRYSQRV